MSRKADADTIGPLCSDFVAFDRVGCHTAFDAIPEAFARRFPAFDPEKVSRETEAAWLAAQPKEK